MGVNRNKTHVQNLLLWKIFIFKFPNIIILFYLIAYGASSKGCIKILMEEKTFIDVINIKENVEKYKNTPFYDTPGPL